MKLFPKKRTKIVAFALSAVILVACVSLALAGTLANGEDVSETFVNPYTGKGVIFVAVELGGTRSYNALGAVTWANSDPTVAELIISNTNPNDVTVRGLSLGLTAVAAGTKSGIISNRNFYVRDMKNIASYTIRGGIEGYIAAKDGTLTVPVTLLDGDGESAAKNRITWKSLNPEVATVDANGTVKALVSKGVALIIGEFTDPWGLKHDLHYLVYVGIDVKDLYLKDLADKIKEAEEILNNPDGYLEPGLDVLEDAKDNGVDILDRYGKDDDLTQDDIDDAIKQLEDALNGLKERTKAEVTKFLVRDERTGDPVESTITVKSLANGYTKNWFSAVVEGPLTSNLASWSVDDSNLFCDNEDQVEYVYWFGYSQPYKGSLDSVETVYLSLAPNTHGSLIITAKAVDDPSMEVKFTINVSKS